MAQTLRSAYSDLFLSTMLPAIDKILVNEYESQPSFEDKLFNIKQSSRSIEQTTGLGGLGQFSKIQEGEEIGLDSPDQTYSKTFTHDKYGNGFKVSEEVIDDANYDKIGELSRELARAKHQTRQVLYADIFNSGFSDTGPDGKSLFATDHPGADGATFSNKPTNDVDLSESSLNDAIINFRGSQEYIGHNILIRPKYLMVPETLEQVANILVKSTQRPETANNDINPLQASEFSNSLQVLVNPFLTGTNDWYLCAEPAQNFLMLYRRNEKRSVHDVPKTEDIEVRQTFRESFGYADWRGLYGSQGA